MQTTDSRFSRLGLVYLFWVAVLAPLLAEGAPARPIPSPPAIGARAFILQDFNSTQTIAAFEPDLRVEPASLTKMMTAYVVSQEIAAGNLSSTDTVRISEKAWRTPGSRMFVEVNTRVSVEDLLRGVIIQSGNDACVALAEHIAGSEEAFAQMMNHQAQRLGMTGTHFTNSTGLPDPEHYTTVQDLATLSRALIRDFPDHYALYAENEFTYNDITQHNRNTLLWWDKSVDGIKTGHTESAGYCLAASAIRDGMRLIGIVVGTESEKARAQETQKLLTYGFRFYETHRLYTAGATLTEHPIWMGADDTVALGLAEDFFVTVPRGRYDALRALLTVENRVEAPVRQGAALGAVQVKLGEEDLAQRPLVALTEVEEGGLLRRLWHWIKLFFLGFFE